MAARRVPLWPKLLLKEKHRVVVVEHRPDIIERLRQELPPECVYEGDGSLPSVLEEAGISEANVVAAVTGEDEANLVVCMLARFEYNVSRIIARVNNPKNAWLFNAGDGCGCGAERSGYDGAPGGRRNVAG